MPTASIDFTLAVSAMIVLALGAIFGVNIVSSPYINDIAYNNERYYQIGRYLLLSQGEPADWGIRGLPTSFGLASGQDPYQLDIDKVNRLYPTHKYAVNYSTMWQTLGINDVSFKIEIDLIFDVVLSLLSTRTQGNSILYNFTIHTTKNGFPLACQLRYYVVVRNSTYSSIGITNESGYGEVQFSIPRSLNGTAVLIGIARTQGSIVSYSVLPFSHNSSLQYSPNEFAHLSPFNRFLYFDLEDNVTAWNAAVLSFEYSLNLTASGSGYKIPYVLGCSPLIITLTGVSGSDYWVEWAAYPQIPLKVGVDMSIEYSISDVYQEVFIVEINGALYRTKILFRSTADYDK